MSKIDERATNKRVRAVGILLMLLFGAVFAQLNFLQVVKADEYAHDPRNTRNIEHNFDRDRGQIISADGQSLAYSERVNGDFNYQRFYDPTTAALFGHLTGFFSFTYGADGLEQEYDSTLAQRSRPVDLNRLDQVLRDTPLTRSITLTVSKRAQQAAADALDGQLGSLVALDPRTGAILAVYSNPSWDPAPMAGHGLSDVTNYWNQLQADPSRPMLPRAFRETYAPGSTFKIITATSGLENEAIRSSYPVLSGLSVPGFNQPLGNFGGGSCGGSIENAFRVSCNTVFGQVGLDVGGDALAKTAEDFGFGTSPPLDFPAVSKSVFSSGINFEVDQPALAQSAIGQRDVKATPLQMAMVAAAIANRGEIMKPYLVAKIEDSDSNTVKTTQPSRWRTATTPQIADTIKQWMVEVVNRGTGTRARLDGVQVAAKTGTAEAGEFDNAWMVAFAPADNPVVALAVFIEGTPQHPSRVGGSDAGPVVKHFLQSFFQGNDEPKVEEG